MRQYGVHIALVIAVLLNVVQFFTRPKTNTVDKGTQVKFEDFARKVTRELLDMSYISYEQSTMTLLQQDLAPNVKAALMQAEKLPKSQDDLKASLKTLTDQRQVSSCRIDSVNQSDPNEKGLIPIDVQGVVAVHSAEEGGPAGPVPFHFQYLMGLTGGSDPAAQRPIVADFHEVH